jgi:hypothetical protein
MTRADTPDGKKNRWWVPARELRPVHEAVIIVALGYWRGVCCARSQRTGIRLHLF